MASPFNTTTLGNHGRVALAGPFASPILLKIFDLEWERTEERVMRPYINGHRQHYSFGTGYSGSFNFDRVDGELEDAIAAADNAMDSNGFYQNWEITFQITPPNGEVQTLTFHGAAVQLTKGGTYRQNQVVTSTVHFVASTMSTAGVDAYAGE